MLLRSTFCALMVAGLLSLASCTPRRPAGTTPTTLPASQAQLKSVDPNAPVIRIGSWKLRWLGPSVRDRFESRTPEDLAGYIAESGVSVLAMQEVGQTPGTTLRNSTLDATFAFLNQSTQGDWQYVLMPSQDPDQTSLIGFAWNQAIVRLEQAPFELNTPRGKSTPGEHRTILEAPPAAARFSCVNGSGSFGVIAVDFAGNVGPGDHVAHRVAEAQALVAALPAAESRLSTRDFVLLGNFEMPLSNETAGLIIQAAGFRDLNAGDLATHATGNAYERAYVPQDAGQFARDKSIEVVDDAGMGPDVFRQKLSDSHMIVVDFPRR